MSETPAPTGPAQDPQQLLDTIGAWVLSVLRTEPGWDRVVVDLKVQGGRVHLRVREHRGDEVVPGTAGPVKEGSAVLPAVEQLRERVHRPGRGTWFTATVTIAAEGWPQPVHRVGGTFELEHRPEPWAEEGPYTAQDLVAHLERFPRTRERIPAWADELARRAGVRLPVAGEDARDEDARGGTAAPSAPGDAGTGAPEDPEGTVHPGVRAAVEAFAAAPDDAGMIEVLRQATAGTLLLDVTASTLVPGPEGRTVGPDSQLRVQTLTEADGTRSLAVYTSAAEARAMHERHRGREEQPVLLRESAVRILQMVVEDEQYDHLVVDPAHRGCRISRPQLEWVVRTPRNDAAKAALAEGSMPQLFAALLAPPAVLLLGVRVQDGRAVPVWARPAREGAAPDTMLLFTSAAEIAALDRSLEVRSAPARQALRFALDSGARAVCLNARPPVATLGAEQLRELLALVDEPDAGGPGAAPGDGPAEGSGEQGPAAP